MWTASPICFWLERQVALRALSRAWAKTGKRIAASMAMIAITTSSSIRVKPQRRRTTGLLSLTRPGEPLGAHPVQRPIHYRSGWYRPTGCLVEADRVRLGVVDLQALARVLGELGQLDGGLGPEPLGVGGGDPQGVAVLLRTVPLL